MAMFAIMQFPPQTPSTKRTQTNKQTRNTLTKAENRLVVAMVEGWGLGGRGGRISEGRKKSVRMFDTLSWVMVT